MLGPQFVPITELLGKVIDNRGRSCPTSDSGIPLIATNCIRNEDLYPIPTNIRYVSQETYDSWFRGHPEPGDLIFVNKGTPGRVCLVPDPINFCIAQDMVALRPNKRVTNLYLLAALRSPQVQNQIRQMEVGTMIPHFKKGDFQKLLIPVFDLASQRAVGKIYYELSLKIDTNINLSKTLEEIAQAVFKSWFVDFDPVKAKMAGEKPFGMDNATAALFSDSMEDSELGLIPKNWTSTRLDDELLLLESGKRPRGGAAGESGVPSIGAESIRELGTFDFSNTKFIPIDFYDSMPSGRVNEFDVLVYKDGAGAGSYVSMFGCGFPFEKFAINEHVFLLRAKSVSQYFLYFWMSQNKIKNLMIELAQKSAQPGLNQKDMRTIGFLRPETSVVEKFSEIVEPIIMEVMKLAKQSRHLSTIRDTLLPRLISGELQIPEEMLVTA